MGLQKLIDGLKNHRNGAASYESVDEAIRVFESMRDMDGEKVCKGLECCVLRDPDDHRRCGECPYNPHAISNEPCANGLKFNALALIRQQQERIEELEEAQRIMVYQDCLKPEWISVKDMLPDDGKFVLVCNDDGKMMIAKHENEVMRWEYKYMNYDWDVWDDDEQGPVCYWMLLPEPPKEEEQ